MKNEELIAKLQKLPMDCEILDVDIVKYSKKSNEVYFEERYVRVSRNLVGIGI